MQGWRLAFGSLPVARRGAIVRPMMRAVFAVIVRMTAAASAVLAVGCDALSEFGTGDDSIYRGEVIGSDSEDGQSSFIRQGFPSHTRLDMTFDTARASAYADPGQPLEPAGTIDTYVCGVDDSPCPEAERTPGSFRGSALELIPNLTHDALSEYEFPGGGRRRSYIFVSRFELADELASRQGAAMVFVSLMDDGGVELRVIAPAELAADGSVASSGLFGVFVLKRQSL
jgi:hypothetical protein